MASVALASTSRTRTGADSALTMPDGDSRSPVLKAFGFVRFISRNRKAPHVAEWGSRAPYETIPPQRRVRWRDLPRDRGRSPHRDPRCGALISPGAAGGPRPAWARREALRLVKGEAPDPRPCHPDELVRSHADRRPVIARGHGDLAVPPCPIQLIGPYVADWPVSSAPLFPATFRRRLSQRRSFEDG